MESPENREQSVNDEVQETQQLSKDKAIASLKDTIQQLEGIVEEIDASQQEDLAIDSPIDTLVKTTQELAQTITPVVEVAEPEVATTVDAEPTSPPEETVTKDIVASPKSTIVKAKQPKRNLPLIIGGIAGLIIIAAIAVWQFYPQQFSQLIAIDEPTVTETKTIPEEVKEEKNKDIVVVAPVIEPAAEPEIIAEPIPPVVEAEDPIPEIIEETPTEPDEIASVEIPADLASPGKAKTIKIKKIAPKIVLTPEQKLIATIQNKLDAITVEDGAEIIASIEPNFINSSLEIRVKDTWYELDAEKQDKTANDILERSRKLAFQKLEVKDTKGILVARNPVVGDRAIVIQPLEEKSS